jgi:hypothetical protein
MKGFREFSKKVTMEVDFTIRLLVLEFVELVPSEKALGMLCTGAVSCITGVFNSS